MPKREGNRPDRRIAPYDFVSVEMRQLLVGRLTYVGSAHHKLRPGDYGFVPPQNPRASKSPCDELRPVLLAEASALFQRAIELGMFSRFTDGGSPKYVWAVDDFEEVYEAKTRPELSTEYHGYRLGEDDRVMRRYVLIEWRQRCQNP
jgi:hypothetical protein